MSAPRPMIDVALTVLCNAAKPGQTMSHQAIAEVCDCSRNLIFEIEKKALRKLRRYCRINNYSLNDYI